MAQVQQKVKEVQKSTVSYMNKQQSKIFVKRMLAISVSTITYMRNLFPEKAFSDRKLEDMNVKILSQNTHDGAATVINWMKGVYDAIDQEYLQTMMLAIVSDPLDPMSVLETYSFGFQYINGEILTSMNVDGKSGNVPPNIPTTEATKHSARKLVRNLIVLTHNMSALPRDVFMTVRLLYYDNRTPSDYQPPGFVVAEEKDVLHNVTDNIRIKVGNLDTPFYNVKLRANTPKHEYIEASENSRSSSQVVPPQFESVLSNSQLKKKLTEVAKEEKKNKTGLGVRCPCGDLQVEGPMILCTVCNFSQHSICFSVSEDEIENLNNHMCCWCSDKSGNTGTDLSLWHLSDEGRRDLCLWRRTLRLCFSVERVTYAILNKKFKCGRGSAQKMVNKLQTEEVQTINRVGSKVNKEINLEVLTKLFEEIFSQRQQKINEEGVMDDSQAMDVDPVVDDHLFAHPGNPDNKMLSRSAKKRKSMSDSGIGNDSDIYDFNDGDESNEINGVKPKKMSRAIPAQSSYLN